MAPEGLIGESTQFRSVLEEVAIVGPMDCTVLILGETGTGKEVIARALHDSGARKHRPFVAINCAAIPSALLESELFGHEKGAFTGAVSQTTGRFLAAHNGTLFLDEIGDLPLELQPKLLRVLQEQQFERLGSIRTTHVDVRIIAATNLRLEELVEQKLFRADLYYRLSVFPLELPALRERKGDIELLARHFVQRYSARLGKSVNDIPVEVLDVMAEYPWPGNVRELQNFVERSVIMTTGPVLSPRLAELELMARTPPVQAVSAEFAKHFPDPKTLLDAEREHILLVLQTANWVVGGRDGAAARLGIPRTTLISKMERLGIRRNPPEGTGTSIHLV